MNLPKGFYIVGSGGLAKEAFEIYKRKIEKQYKKFPKFVGFLDENEDNCFPERNTYKLDDFCMYRGYSLTIAIGDCAIRQRIFEKFKDYHIYSLVHTSCNTLGPLATGRGSIIFPFTSFSPNVTLGLAVIVYHMCSVSHDSKIGDFCTLCPGVNIAGKVKVGNRCFFGIGSTVINNIEICDDVVLAAGAVVVKNIVEPGTYVGVPARKIDDKNF